jgi:menaquinone-dependent protoporphyrinogen oxidase
MEVHMQDRVLVAYASKYDATAEIAEKIGEVIRQEGFQVDVLPAEKAADVSPYKAVVLGSAVYIGAWRKQAAEFLKVNEPALSEMPVWFFSSGPTGEGDPVERLQGWRFPESLQPVADRVKPRDTVVFHGMLNIKKMNFLEKWVTNKMKAPVGDFRDWQAVAAWAAGIAEALKQAE